MSNDKYCAKHGAYDSQYTSCPYCLKEKGRPVAPASLDEQVTGAYGVPAAQQKPSGQGSSRQPAGDDEVTQIPRKHRSAKPSDDALDETQVDRPQSGLLGWVVVKAGMRRGSIHRIGHDVTLGRKNADIVLQDQKVSKLHAKFAIQNEQFVVADMLSENGTFVNEERIDRITPLQENDEIRVGDTVLVLKVLAP